MAGEKILVDVKDRIATVTINRPEHLNSLNVATVNELAAVAHRLREDDDVWAVIVTGVGEKAFVAGADIPELVELDPYLGRKLARQGQMTFSLLENLGKPVIAAVNGFALGGGCELALACHIRCASEKAKFGLPEVKLGVIPGYGGTQRLTRIVGLGRGLELILSGELIGAKEAHRIGLVNRVFPRGEVVPGAVALARTILSRGPIAVRLALDAALRGSRIDLESGMALEADLFGLACGTEDKREGLTAFLEKREVHFKGK